MDGILGRKEVHVLWMITEMQVGKIYRLSPTRDAK